MHSIISRSFYWLNVGDKCVIQRSKIQAMRIITLTEEGRKSRDVLEIVFPTGSIHLEKKEAKKFITEEFRKESSNEIKLL